ncbi:gastrula zinc finger protein XlCGF57.1 [Teleopsis dalmanni]|uniref:gastrula zinc finger protein XlCGF57.1 n=1 Tax=Teleopsis dalmanni TaxID=139649 RepID=UPI0018CD9F19|nr:gastrula zinc finger protein XlCGF57.1 [Teleopsis dalmanni]XP_037933857.1 gastrula zinc finger protein XlCGF57.1 [Teleopsis dalmanni]XP_037933858.1 gastrula zinc finger protein XlCGF57.1 [Teleopsis dalmanni]
MVRSRRSISKDYASSLLGDSGISLSSPPAARLILDEKEEEAIIEQLCVTDDEDDDANDIDYNPICDDTNSQKSDNDQVSPSSSLEDETEAKLELSISSSLSTLRTSSIRKSTSKQSGVVAKKSRISHICQICQKEFGGKTDLKRHILIHSNERPHKCEQCSKCFRQAVNLKNHITTVHEDKRQFPCQLCPKSFALKERLRLHMRIHSGEKPYVCNLCDKSFARGGQLKQHQISHHKNSIKKFVCNKCSASFSSPTNLRVHMERHEQGPDHFCEICKEHFPNDVVLRAHIKNVHFKLNQFDCDVCKETIEDGDLITHMKTHKNIKTHICGVCNSCFTQKSQYNVHMRMHTGERPYQCQICWQTFAYSSVLKLHIRVHTGEKPFLCQICKDELGFSQLAHLKTHMKRIHHQDKAYMCTTCNKFFKIKAELQSHVQKCNKSKNVTEERDTTDEDMQTLSHMRFLVAYLYKKISSKQRLQQLGFEKRLIDNVLIASLKLANRKVCDDQNLSAIARLRLNVEEFLNWIVPAKPMEHLRKEQLSVESTLDKIATMYMKQK